MTDEELLRAGIEELCDASLDYIHAITGCPCRTPEEAKYRLIAAVAKYYRHGTSCVRVAKALQEKQP